MKSKIGYFYILLAGIFWSTLGFLVSKISDYNFSPEEVAFFRMVGGFIVISIYGKITMPTMFKITKKGIKELNVREEEWQLFSKTMGLVLRG